MTGARRAPWWVRWLAGPLVALLIRLIARTLRVRFVGREHQDAALADPRPIICAFWHEDLVSIAAWHLRLGHRRRVAVMISRSRDGELLANVIRWLRLEAVRGSSSRGGVGGIVEFKRWIGRRSPHGRAAALALDGPRGPRREAKPGIALLARHSDARILPVAFRPTSAWVFKSWDRTKLPKPFSILECRFAAPIDASDWNADDDATHAKRIEAVLNGLHESGGDPGA
jgi:lysophospholipid acyltransferase (LPLAT)-like uncharacterized protein